MNNDEEKKQNADTQTATEDNVQENQEPKTENKNFQHLLQKSEKCEG